MRQYKRLNPETLPRYAHVSYLWWAQIAIASLLLYIFIGITLGLRVNHHKPFSLPVCPMLFVTITMLINIYSSLSPGDNSV